MNNLNKINDYYVENYNYYYLFFYHLNEIVNLNFLLISTFAGQIQEVPKTPLTTLSFLEEIYLCKTYDKSR